jgi:hypothetical protein
VQPSPRAGCEQFTQYELFDPQDDAIAAAHTDGRPAKRGERGGLIDTQESRQFCARMSLPAVLNRLVRVVYLKELSIGAVCVDRLVVLQDKAGSGG